MLRMISCLFLLSLLTGARASTSQDKFLELARRMSELLARADEQGARRLYPELEKESKKMKRSAADEAMVLQFRVLTSHQLHDEVLSAFELKHLRDNPKFFAGIKRHDTKIYFARSDYSRVVELYSVPSLSKANIDEKILLDIARTLVNKDDSKAELLCREQYDKFPLSRQSSYTMGICSMLMRVREGKKPHVQDYERTRAIISSEFPHSAYLLAVLKKLL